MKGIRIEMSSKVYKKRGIGWQSNPVASQGILRVVDA